MEDLWACLLVHHSIAEPASVPAGLHKVPLVVLLPRFLGEAVLSGLERLDRPRIVLAIHKGQSLGKAFASPRLWSG